jgi:hypothetical protein
MIVGCVVVEEGDAGKIPKLLGLKFDRIQYGVF